MKQQTQNTNHRVPENKHCGHIEHQTPSKWHQTASVGNYKGTDKNIVQVRFDSVVVGEKNLHMRITGRIVLYIYIYIYTHIYIHIVLR